MRENAGESDLLPAPSYAELLVACGDSLRKVQPDHPVIQRKLPPSSHGIVAFNLARTAGHEVDGNGNGVMLVGTYSRRIEGNQVVTLPLVDVLFTYSQ